MRVRSLLETATRGPPIVVSEPGYGGTRPRSGPGASTRSGTAATRAIWKVAPSPQKISTAAAPRPNLGTQRTAAAATSTIEMDTYNRRTDGQPLPTVESIYA